MAVLLAIGIALLTGWSGKGVRADAIATRAHAEQAGRKAPVVLPTGHEGLDEILRILVAHAPYKQVAGTSGTPNPKIGRAPGSACEVIRFLSKHLQANGADQAVAHKLKALADWVVDMQSGRKGSPSYGGVPSTPDLAAPANTYYYAIDAAFCGDAMFRAYELTGHRKYLKSAVAFADFLVAMHTGPRRRRGRAPSLGFCEYIIDNGSRAAWNCRRYVKVLVALPVLRKAASATRRRAYTTVALRARKFLVAGLAGAWEFADAGNPHTCRGRACRPTWRRVPGPRNQPDFFVYGDTLAYALRGLFEYEGLTRDVRTLYDRFSSFAGKGPRSRAYDGRIAFAGYIEVAAEAPDELSAYYDLVTLGILHELRRAHRPEHFEVARAALDKIVGAAVRGSWRVNFDLSVPDGEYIDLSTLANLGEALLLAR